ncbi:hypothetical protein ACVMB3_000945 [Sinorhizobium meliloti]|nr:hypothetical protein SM11_chr2689 [Sinorhizobium meliloti SM11]MBP2466103.1 hypothetical protein [Sinorhizobium meliloti]
MPMQNISRKSFSDRAIPSSVSPNGLRLVDRIADETLLVEVFLFYTPHYYAPHNPVRIPNLKSHTVPFYAKLLGAWIAMGFRNPKMEVAGTVDA